MVQPKQIGFCYCSQLEFLHRHHLPQWHPGAHQFPLPGRWTTTLGPVHAGLQQSSHCVVVPVEDLRPAEKKIQNMYMAFRSFQKQIA